MLIPYDTNMEGWPRTPWSALDQSTDVWNPNIDNVQAMPGMFPVEYEALKGRIPAKTHERPGTVFDRTEEDLSDMETLVELESTEVRGPRPPEPLKPSNPSIKDSSKESSKNYGGAPSNDIVIAVFGQTGTGKSSFISKLTGKDLQIGHGLQSCKLPLVNSASLNHSD